MATFRPQPKRVSVFEVGTQKSSGKDTSMK